MIHYTPTELRILHALSDGKVHTRKDLVLCLNDELSEIGLPVAICKLRKKLGPIGQTIDYVVTGGRGSGGYRHARLLNHDD